MANAIDKAIRSQGGGVVNADQVRTMIIAASRAYKEQSKVGLVDDGVDFDTWRKAALHDIVGAAAPSSFRAVTQRDYAAVVAYFGELAGDARPPRRVKTVQQTGSRRQSDLTGADERARALWALTLAEVEVAGSFGGREGARRYADALFAKIHKTSRIVASARQIWAVIFTLRNRAKRQGAETRARTALGARGAAGVPSSPPGCSERFPAFSRAL